MIIANTKEGIFLRWRDEERKVVEKEISYADFSPYFFVEASNIVNTDTETKVFLKEGYQQTEKFPATIT